MGCTVSLAAGPTCKEPLAANLHDRYVLGKKLGEGAFGQVRLARDKATNEDYAAKIIDVRNIDERGEPTSEVSNARVRETEEEIKVWKQVGPHPNCVRYIQACRAGHLYCMVMEKCSCSLLDKLVSMQHMTEKDLDRIFTDMLTGIAHVHSRGIVHRDIKPDNFLFGGHEAGTVKLCDFGMAEKLPKSGKLRGVYGTAPYMSPEMLKSAGYGCPTDVWSFAAVAYLMVFGDFPYIPDKVSPAAMKAVIKKGVPKPTYSTGNEKTQPAEGLVDFVRTLMDRNPDTRLTATQALELPFLKKKSPERLPASTFRRARSRTTELKRPVNPIVQRGLDELLKQVHERSAAGGAGGLFFSEGDRDGQDGDVPDAGGREARVHRRSVRHGTHSGITAGKKYSEKDRDEVSTNDGTSTTLDTLPSLAGFNDGKSPSLDSLPSLAGTNDGKSSTLDSLPFFNCFAFNDEEIGGEAAREFVRITSL